VVYSICSHDHLLPGMWEICQDGKNIHGRWHYAIIPLLIRMGLVHVVLLFGTNNAIIAGLSLENIQRREIGSKLVLVSRIMYAAW
jgi:hypothetical protein